MESSQITAKEMTESFYREIVSHHGFPEKIISEGDSRFTSNFWTELMKWLQVPLDRSTIFSPQTDGQSE